MKTFVRRTLIAMWGLLLVAVLFYPVMFGQIFASLNEKATFVGFVFRIAGILSTLSALVPMLYTKAKVYGIITGLWSVVPVVAYSITGWHVQFLPFVAIGVLSLATMFLFLSDYPAKN